MFGDSAKILIFPAKSRDEMLGRLKGTSGNEATKLEDVAEDAGVERLQILL